ncbi:GNAT family N-acetyltransferase [Marinomonas aquiplantarum]|uniref:RimJ/RimL family protein N-acetyltransferase n=1 Tax=Marinomonas aquiplantarum TaxID=491951 RepID=A0A366D3U6_9GAMM|nr:GNAT family N-acetyltransferase [Marinomonas aquiplantarum]RBO84731.1 RimJ/RimL family protein N-acetyltransferase [Marinomonas aquiplantarum]
MFVLVELRLATMEDSDLLLEWRNDVATRQASLSSAKVIKEAHLTWLQASLHNNDRCLWMAQLNDCAVGSCRADRQQEGWLLSWTIAPDMRGKGLAYPMVLAMLKTLTGPFFVQIKSDNLASVKVAEKAGFTCQEVKDEVLYFVREVD